MERLPQSWVGNRVPHFIRRRDDNISWSVKERSLVLLMKRLTLGIRFVSYFSLRQGLCNPKIVVIMDRQSSTFF